MIRAFRQYPLDLQIAQDTENMVDDSWAKLLDWLRKHGMKTEGGLLAERRARPGAGYGLFALESCPPASPLFTVPASAIINLRTLEGRYPRRNSPLTAVQLISLHLSLHRPCFGQESLDTQFGPYISILPQDFDSHPLTWLIKAESDSELYVTERRLVSQLPPRISVALEQRAKAFRNDWNVACRYIEESLDANQTPAVSFQFTRDTHLRDSHHLMNFLWAWLNVNTRCIYYSLDAPYTDRIALCPVLDFANHTSHMPHIVPVPTSAESWGTSMRKTHEEDLTFLSPSDVTVKVGDELYLKYGAHSNRTLFIEYGFVDDIPDANEHSWRDFNGEVDIQDAMEELINSSSAGVLIKSVLEDEGYWGNWLLHSSPEPSPSYRVISALRLCHLILAQNTTCSEVDKVIQPWRDVILGRRQIISDVNEKNWRQSLLDICDTIVHRGEAHSRTSDQLVYNDQSWVPWMLKNIDTLWKEEAFVATMVKKSVLDGEEF